MERESPTLEWKADVSRSFLKTVSAYANYGTGRILFGVDDQGRTVGLANPVESSLAIENMVNDCVNPVPVFRLSIDRETSVVTLLVQEGPYTPYL